MGKVEIRVPDIGDFEDVEVVELLVAPGDTVEAEDPLVSIESDKATMEIPSPSPGVVRELDVAVGDLVSEGSLLLVLDTDAGTDVGTEADAAEELATTEALEPDAVAESPPEEDPADSAPKESDEDAARVGQSEVPDSERLPGEPPGAVPPVVEGREDGGAPKPHASPLVRRYARELGVPIAEAQPTGPHKRIVVDDVKARVREVFEAGASASQGRAPLERPDEEKLARHGPVHTEPLSRIRRVSAARLHASWNDVPLVTQHDEADVTELEAFRKSCAEGAAARGLRLSPLLFAMKACAVVLRRHPAFRSALAPGGESLIVRDYYHLGIAVDTDQGLVVPVVRDVDQKGVYELAAEVSELAEKARNRKLAPLDMQGASFSISSLGGIGGSAFTPLVNPPEVAILGLSRTAVKPVWSGGTDLEAGEFRPRLMLPVSLSYDHRVIDGAAAVRFTSELCSILERPGNLLL